eukprot:2839781-Prymnesium_polylepis.1
MPSTRKRCKTLQNHTSLNTAHALLPKASASRARLLAHAPTARPSERASPRRLATSPSSRLDPQPPRHRRRRLSCAPRGHQ